MNSNELQRLIVKETIRVCGHQERQGELHMSCLHLPDELIIKYIREGNKQEEKSKSKLFQGTWAEEGMTGRLYNIFHPDGTVKASNLEINAYGGRLIGHIDFLMDVDVFVEYMSFGTPEKLMIQKNTGKIPRKKYCQIQSYLLWGKFDKAFFIGEDRDEGELWVKEIYPDHKFQSELKAKVERLLPELEKNAA